MLRSQSVILVATEGDSQHLHRVQQPQDEQNDLLSDNRLQFLYLTLGTGTLFAYNVFMSCVDYFNAVNPNAQNISGQMATFQLTFMFFTTILILPFTTNKMMTKISGAEKDESYYILPARRRLLHNLKQCTTIYSPGNRVLHGFTFTFFFLLVFLSLPLSAITPPTLNLFSVFVGIADAASQSGLYILASSYNKPTLSASASLGGALSGFISSSLRLITRGMFDTESVEGLGRGANLLIWLAFLFTVFLIGSVLVIIKDLEKRHQLMIRSNLTDNNEVEVYSHGTAVLEEARTDNDASRKFNVESIYAIGTLYRTTFILAWKPIVSAFLNFFITLALFPGVTVDIPSSNDRFSFGSWLPVVLIAIFNGADCAGRYVLAFESMLPYRLLMVRADASPQILDDSISNHQGMHNSGTRTDDGINSTRQQRAYQGQKALRHYNKLVWWPTFGRIIFFPILSICILPSGGPIINPDILKCVVIFLFGASNGFIHCANFTVGPTIFYTEDAKNCISMLLLLAIYAGLSSGAFFGLLVEKVIRGLG